MLTKLSTLDIHSTSQIFNILNYLKYYNEGTGAYLIRKKLLKNKDKKIRRYSTYNLIYLIINMILAIISLAIYTIYSLNILSNYWLNHILFSYYLLKNSNNFLIFNINI